MDLQYSLLQEERNVFHIFKYKYYLILFTIVAATFMLLVINVQVDMPFQSHEIHLTWNKLHNLVDSDSGYFVKTEGCTIPAFNAFDSSIREYVHSVDPILCHNSTNPPLVESNRTNLWVVEKYFPNYEIDSISHLKCCYKEFYRSTKKKDDSHYDYGKMCIQFNRSAKIVAEYVEVKCYNDGLEIYTDYHAFIKNIRSKSKQSKTSKSDAEKLSILILGLDAVSRLNFHRTMPLTLKFLESLDVVEFKGYNKVGDNTYPNLVPLLSGLSADELKATCLPDNDSTFDDCPFVWKNYSKAGYLTAFGEDAAQMSLFNYFKNGFREQPTDYYWRTFDYLSEKNIGHEKRFNAKLCLGPRMTVDALLAYVKKFTSTMKDTPYFSFFWETTLTHDALNYPTLGDKKYYYLLKQMHTQGLLSKTVLLMVSDHGIRWGDIRRTHQGRMEERLPFLFVALPKKFNDRFPLASSNLRRNTRRLTTPFDLHETLMDLSNLDEIENEKIREKSTDSSHTEARGVSLFLPVGENRTCASAGIDAHWCTCHETRKIAVSDAVVLQVASFVVAHINRLLVNYVECVKLKLAEITDATVGEPSKSIDMASVAHVVQDYTVVVRTRPGGGLFEATARRAATGWNVTGTVSRINLYGKQSHCIDNFHLKLYCYCDRSFSKIFYDNDQINGT